MDTKSFFTLIHLGLVAIYLWEIVCFIWNRQKYPELIKQIKEADPDFLTEDRNDGWGFAWGFGALHCGFYGLVTEQWPVVLIALFGAAVWSGIYNENLKLAMRHHMHENDHGKQSRHQENADNFGNEDSGDFAYERSSYQSARSDDTPYGFDKRHPDDAGLWNVVDDPSASDNERQQAFSMILKRTNRRKESGTAPIRGAA